MMRIPGQRRLRALGCAIRDMVRMRLPHTDPMKAQVRWLVSPNGQLAGREVTLLVTLAREGRITEHALFLAKAWANQGFAVVLIVAADNVDQINQQEATKFCEGVLVRQNVGYDFGAWAAGIRRLPELRDATLVALTNDSAFGPMNTFGAMLDRVRCAPADVIGTIESAEHHRHIQSFLIFFKPPTLCSQAFELFWNRVRNGDREWAIRHYEERLEAYFRHADFRTMALYPSSARSNPGLHSWAELIATGFPFIKIQLLRDNPYQVDLSGWQDMLAHHSYDPQIAERHLALYSPHAAGLHTVASTAT